MITRTARRLRSLVALVVLVAITVGVPLVLARFAGWPLPHHRPHWNRVTTALRQGDIAGDVVIKTIAVIVWIAWAQLIWALAWELAINLPRITRGRQPKPAPLVPVAVGAGIGRLVALVLSIGLTIATTPSPALARQTAPIAPVSTLHSQQVADQATPTMVSQLRNRAAYWQVADGESLWDIAERALGDGSRATEIIELNATLQSPRDLRAGQTLRLPADASIPTDRAPVAATDIAVETNGDSGSSIVIDIPPPGFLPDTVITIERGDTLWDLAEDRLESMTGAEAPNRAILEYVDVVIDANPTVIEDPNLIFPGEQFEFPAIGTPPPPTPPEQADPTAPLPALAPPSPAALPTPAPPPLTTMPPPATTNPVPTTTPPVNAGPVVPLPTPPPLVESVSARGPESTTPWLAGISGATVLASGLLLTYRRLRSRRLINGAANLPAANPIGERRRVEQAMIAASDVPLVRWANHELAVLFQHLNPRRITGAPVAVELSENHGLELLWDTPNPTAPAPWEATDGGWAWRLLYDPDFPIRSEPDPPPIPGLVTIGTRDDNTVLVDLEAFGSIAIIGDPTRAEDLMRAIVLELASNEDLANSYIHTVGIDIDGLEHLPRVQTRTDSDAVKHLREIATDHDRLLTAAALPSTFHLRLGSTAHGRELTVIAAQADATDQLDELIAAARPRRGAVAIILGPHPDAAATITIDTAGNATLNPLALSVHAAGVPRCAAAQVAILLDEASNSDSQAAIADEREEGPATQTAPSDERFKPQTFDFHTELGDLGTDDDWSEPQPELLVKVLGVPRIDSYPNLGRLELNLVTFLACNHGSATEDQLIDAIWNGRAIERTTVWNRISKARAALGRHLPARDQGSNTVRLAAGVITDLDIFETLTTRASHVSSTDAIELLTRAMTLIDGAPFDAAGYDWAHEHQHHARACELIESGALRLVDIALDHDDPATARLAISQGLRALRINEPLYRARMRLEAHVGNHGGVRTTYDELVRLLDELAEPGETYQPSNPTKALLEQLVSTAA